MNLKRNKTLHYRKDFMDFFINSTIFWWHNWYHIGLVTDLAGALYFIFICLVSVTTTQIHMSLSLHLCCVCFLVEKRYMYCRLRSNCPEGVEVEIDLTPQHMCACPKPGPESLTSYSAIFVSRSFWCTLIWGEMSLSALLISVELLPITVLIFFSYSIMSYLQEYCWKLVSFHWCSYKFKHVQTLLWEYTHLKYIFTSTCNYTNFTWKKH